MRTTWNLSKFATNVQQHAFTTHSVHRRTQTAV